MFKPVPVAGSASILILATVYDPDVSDNFDQVKKERAEISARNDTQLDQKAANIFYCMPIFICLVSFLIVVLRKRARRV